MTHLTHPDKSVYTPNLHNIKHINAKNDKSVANPKKRQISTLSVASVLKSSAAGCRRRQFCHPAKTLLFRKIDRAVQRHHQSSGVRQTMLIEFMLDLALLLGYFKSNSIRYGLMTSKNNRYDERDNIFARRDLIPGTSEFESFYESHPALKERDDEWRKRPELGSGIHAADMGLYKSPAEIMRELGRPDVVDGSPAAAKQKLSPDRAALKVKAFARRLGADLTGISALQQDFVYTHRGRIKYAEEPWGSSIECRHSFAISLGFREDIQLIKTAPHAGELFESALVYYRSASAAVVLANYIRSLGYAARAHHFRNYQVMSVPLAVEAGLGELARCGFLLTKEYGNCLRLSTVTTELPLQLDQPVDIGVQDFCDRCKLCADACPSKAISRNGKRGVRGVLKWQIDDVKCYSYWSKAGTDCGMCIASCPWSQPDVWHHNAAADWASKWKLARILLLWLYPIVYGPYKPKHSPDWIEPRRQ